MPIIEYYTKHYDIMNKRYYVLSLLFCFVLMSIHAQSFQDYKRQQQQQYRQYRSQTQKEYNEFRRKANEEYASLMKQKWTPMNVRPAIPAPALPEPPKPVVKENEEQPQKQELEVKKVVKPQEEYKAPDPVAPIEKPIASDRPQWLFLFYDTPCYVHLNKDMKFRMSDATEASAAAAWEILSDAKFDNVISDCLDLRKKLNLNDWGYISLLKELTTTFLTDGNEAVLMQMYILTQSGYKVRIARTDQNKLVLLMPFSDDLYQYSYISKDNLKYYVLANVKNGASFSVFDRVFPKEKIANLRSTSAPVLSFSATRERDLTSKKYPQMSFKIKTNQNLIDYYNNYPVTDHWNFYANTSLSKDVKSALYPKLQQVLQNKSKLEAVSMLLNFVQTAFEYQTDQQQFGYERPLFADETLFYPYCDCEDRSILFSVLVKELLKLDVVLLYYPGHLATAVCLPEDVKGAYLKIDGKNYTVCDPTYIGASVGDCMPNYKQTQPEVVKL